MADITTTPVVVYQQESSGAIYWIAGLIMAGGAVATAWYFLIKKPADLKAAEASTIVDTKGNDVDIKPDPNAPDTATDTLKVISEFDKKEQVATAMDSATAKVNSTISNASSVSGMSLDTMTKIVGGDTIEKFKGKSGYSAGQTVKANGSQSIQRMKKVGGQISDKNDKGKLFGYSKVNNEQTVGTVEVRYDGGMVVKAPDRYAFPYYYVKYSQVK